MRCVDYFRHSLRRQPMEPIGFSYIPYIHIQRVLLILPIAIDFLEAGRSGLPPSMLLSRMNAETANSPQQLHGNDPASCQVTTVSADDSTLFMTSSSVEPFPTIDLGDLPTCRQIQGVGDPPAHGIFRNYGPAECKPHGFCRRFSKHRNKNSRC